MSFQLVDNGCTEGKDLAGVYNRVIPVSGWNYGSSFSLTNLVYSALNGRVEDARDEEGLDIRRVDVELLRDEFDVDAGVRLYQLDENLRRK